MNQRISGIQDFKGLTKNELRQTEKRLQLLHKRLKQSGDLWIPALGFLYEILSGSLADSDDERFKEYFKSLETLARSETEGLRSQSREYEERIKLLEQNAGRMSEEKQALLLELKQLEIERKYLQEQIAALTEQLRQFQAQSQAERSEAVGRITLLEEELKEERGLQEEERRVLGEFVRLLGKLMKSEVEQAQTSHHTAQPADLAKEPGSSWSIARLFKKRD